MPQRGMVERMKGAAMIDVATFEEVEHDREATMQAAGVVVLVAVASAIGSLGAGAGGIISALLGPLVGWAVWAGVTFFIGTRLFDGTATWGELLRTLGFAQAPGVLKVFAIIPLLGWIVSAVVFLWMLWAGIVAVRQALDFSTGKALMTVGIGWVAMVFLGVFWALLF